MLLRPASIVRYVGSFLSVLSLQLIGGCASYNFEHSDGRERHYLGYVKIYGYGKSTGGIEAEKILFAGAKIKDGLEVGFSNSRVLSIPLDCRLVVLVESGAQAEEAISKISHLRLDKVCASEF